MRKSLVNYVGDFVLVIGVMDTWFEKEDSHQVLIKNAVIKKGDKEKLFDDQKLISKEDHLNIFSTDLFENFNPKRYEKVTFGGIINSYTRSNGTKDYGVQLIQTSNFHSRWSHRKKTIIDFRNKWHGECLAELINQEFLPSINQSLDELETSKDQLPTFVSTYSEYLEELKFYKNLLEEDIKDLNFLMQNRSYRRYSNRRNKKEYSRFCKSKKTLTKTKF